MKIHKEKMTFDKWLDDVTIEWVARKLKVHPQTVRHWRIRRNDPRVDQMRRIRRLSGKKITYEMMIDRRPITTKGTYRF